MANNLENISVQTKHLSQSKKEKEPSSDFMLSLIEDANENELNAQESSELISELSNELDNILTFEKSDQENISTDENESEKNDEHKDENDDEHDEVIQAVLNPMAYREKDSIKKLSLKIPEISKLPEDKAKLEFKSRFKPIEKEKTEELEKKNEESKLEINLKSLEKDANTNENRKKDKKKEIAEIISKNKLQSKEKHLLEKPQKIKVEEKPNQNFKFLSNMQEKETLETKKDILKAEDTKEKVKQYMPELDEVTKIEQKSKDINWKAKLVKNEVSLSIEAKNELDLNPLKKSLSESGFNLSHEQHEKHQEKKGREFSYQNEKFEENVEKGEQKKEKEEGIRA